LSIIEALSSLQRCPRGILLLCLLFILVAGCHSREGSERTVPAGEVLLSRIAVVPFQQVASEEARIGPVECPLCGRVVNASRTPGNPERILEGLLLTRFDKANPQFTVQAGERVEGVYRRIAAGSLNKPLAEVLRETGRELEADGVLIGFLYRFRERRGVSYTVEQPASVAFEFHLLRVRDGVSVWRGVYDRTQSSLMEDLLQLPVFFRERGRWVTAEELAAEGVERILETFPGLR
jgi:hypothetical protein